MTNISRKELKANLIDWFILIDEFLGDRDLSDKEKMILSVTEQSISQVIRGELGVEHAGHYVREWMNRHNQPYSVPLLEAQDPENAVAFVEFLFDYRSITEGLQNGLYL